MGTLKNPMAAYKNKKWTRKRVTRKRIVDKGVNSKGNKYTVYTDGSYRYDNADGDYHYNNSDGSTYTKRGNQDYFTAPDGTKWQKKWIRTKYLKKIIIHSSSVHVQLFQ